jgi:hypothetical protein
MDDLQDEDWDSDAEGATGGEWVKGEWVAYEFKAKKWWLKEERMKVRKEREKLMAQNALKKATRERREPEAVTEDFLDPNEPSPTSSPEPERTKPPNLSLTLPSEVVHIGVSPIKPTGSRSRRTGRRSKQKEKGHGEESNSRPGSHDSVSWKRNKDTDSPHHKDKKKRNKKKAKYSSDENGDSTNNKNHVKIKTLEEHQDEFHQHVDPTGQFIQAMIRLCVAAEKYASIEPLVVEARDAAFAARTVADNAHKLAQEARMEVEGANLHRRHITYELTQTIRKSKILLGKIKAQRNKLRFVLYCILCIVYCILCIVYYM